MKHEMVVKKIKDLVKSGKNPKEAMAMALSGSMKYADGGMVDDDDEINRSLGEIAADGVDYPEKISNPEEQKEPMSFSDMLRKQAVDEEENFAMGGLVEGMSDTPVGNKPSEAMSATSAEPASDIDKAIKDAIENKKKKRAYSI